MKLLLDACVLYPTVTRQMLLGAAGQGHFAPLWSARILEEWRRATAKLGPAGPPQAEAEIALLRAAWPRAEVPPAPGIEARLWLPDPADIHVLAAAIAGSADAIVTFNARDFPRHILAEDGLARTDPDTALMDLFSRDPEGLAATATAIHADARRSGFDGSLRALMKKARLSRLGKALG